ncbi:MAG TPA: hypothetical protein DD379_22725 [Cyanobacteria bacterium UBA11162]|nr:hypothetical protein [Cyanobacteria bacterium UBA11162]
MSRAIAVNRGISFFLINRGGTILDEIANRTVESTHKGTVKVFFFEHNKASYIWRINPSIYQG